MYLNALIQSEGIVFIQLLTLVIYFRTTNYTYTIFQHHGVCYLAQNVASRSLVRWKQFRNDP